LQPQLLPKCKQYRACLHTCVFCDRSVHADIRVRLDGVENEHGIVRVAKDGKVRNATLKSVFILVSLQVFVKNLSNQHPLLVNGEHFLGEYRAKNGDHLTIIDRVFRFDFTNSTLKGNLPQLTSTPNQVCILDCFAKLLFVYHIMFYVYVLCDVKQPSFVAEKDCWI